MKKKKILKFIRNLLIIFFGSSILSVIALRFIPVYFTPLMFIRTAQQIIHGEDIKWKHTWVSKEKISRHLPMAVIASEDNRFAEHNGFDFKEIEKAMEENKTRKRPRRRKHYQPTNCQERVFMAGLLLAEKRAGSVFHDSHRIMLE